MSIKINGQWVSLHTRAQQLIAMHGKQLTQSQLVFLTMLTQRKIVWGTAYQLKKLERIEADLNKQPA